MTSVLVVVVALLAGAVAYVVMGRPGTRTGSNRRDGVSDFRRHIDALSPEARRSVIDRGREPRDDGPKG